MPTPKPMRLRAGLALAVLLMACSGLVGCSSRVSSQPCMPPPFSLGAATVKAGGTVTVTAKNATCNPRYGESAQIQVTLRDSRGAELLKKLGPMQDQGGFSLELHVPAGVAPGPAAVEAYPYNLDWCDDTGRNNRVGLGATDATVERASCAARIQKLLIEP